MLHFDGAIPSTTHAALPVFGYKMRLPGEASVEIILDIIDEEQSSFKNASLLPFLGSAYSIRHEVRQERGTWYAQIWLEPLRKDPALTVFKLLSRRIFNRAGQVEMLHPLKIILCWQKVQPSR
jgi:hypothetical protein